MAFTACGGNLKEVFITEAEIIDRYVGNQLWAWGANLRGNLGTNNTASSSSPVQTIAGGTNWKQVSAGNRHTSSIKTDGTLWSFGYGMCGQLGHGLLTLGMSSPVQTIAGGTNWNQVSAGAYHTTAIKTDGTLWLWGTNASGRLGTNNTGTQSSPVQTVAGGTNWKQVSAGAFHTAAVKTDGTLWLWGCGAVGQLGNDNVASQSSPVQTIAGGTNWKQVSAGKCISGAVKTDGTLWAWGYKTNSVGTANQSSPVQTVAGGTNWKQVSVGSAAIGAIKTDGTLWLWGNSAFGVLGNGSGAFTGVPSPVQTIAGGTNWKQVSTCNVSTTAIKTDGTLWVWGYNQAGILGTGTTTSVSSPVQTVAGGNNWKQSSVSDFHMAAITFTS